MQTSIFLARLIGPVMALVGVSLLVNELAFRKMAQEFLRSPALIFFSGMILMPAGLASFQSQRLGAELPLIITLLGWIGDRRTASSRLTAPSRSARRRSRKYTTAAAAFWLVIAPVLCTGSVQECNVMTSPSPAPISSSRSHTGPLPLRAGLFAAAPGYVPIRGLRSTRRPAGRRAVYDTRVLHRPNVR
jgi:hypothetical protein